MNASDPARCPRCGAALPANSAETPCPACLLSGALDPPDGPDETIAMEAGSPRARGGAFEFPCAFGNYRLLGMLGRGGMGTVYEAEDTVTGRRLALKMLEQKLDSPEMRHRFLREGRLAASVSHPNSLYIFGSEEIDGIPVITMEIAGGGTLSDKLKKRGPLPVAEAVDHVLDVISGLEAALAAGVLHRDVKPSNCFVDPDGSVKVGDFGLSVSTMPTDDSYVTATGVIMGTPAYAPPEQLRGDEVDERADIYSVGATLFTLLSGQAPFEGNNAVQIVANVMMQKPKPLARLREDLPPALVRVVTRCLAKEPQWRYESYSALRNALLPFSSREAEPAAMPGRIAAGWVDYLLAFLPAYAVLMFTVGGNELLVRPLVERTLSSARYYFLLLGIAVLYSSILEGLWGAGVGKWLKGMRVVRANGRPPGLPRALLRALIPILCAEGIRMPLMLLIIHDAEWTGLQTVAYVLGAIVCCTLPALLTLRARHENGFATLWDRLSGTRVVMAPRGVAPPAIEVASEMPEPAEDARSLGPYLVLDAIVPEGWLLATDPVLRRRVWLLRRTSREPSGARRRVARIGRLRWLQEVESGGVVWDAYEALPGVPFSDRIRGGKKIPWDTLRHWLHGLAAELWSASGDQTLPPAVSLDHVWITLEGNAILLDEAWPHGESPAISIPLDDIQDQQRFLDAVAACVETTSLPLHARPVLRNLARGKFEKLSFLTGILRGLLEKKAEVGRGVRAGSIFLIPVYMWIAVLVGRYHDRPWDDPLRILLLTALVALGGYALMQLLVLPFGTSIGHSIFRLAVVDAGGRPAHRARLLARWAIVWLPLCLPAALILLLRDRAEGLVLGAATLLLLLWVGFAFDAVFHPHRGRHDRWVGSWVVRQ